MTPALLEIARAAKEEATLADGDDTEAWAAAHERYLAALERIEP